jgi:lipoprotein-anchoring transpeptidase ErfK/SrfK
MLRIITLLAAALTLSTPARAYNDPISRGLAEFLNIFSVQAVPRQVLPWRKGYGPGIVVISTRERRLYYVLGYGQAIRYGVGSVGRASPGRAPSRSA